MKQNRYIIYMKHTVCVAQNKTSDNTLIYSCYKHDKSHIYGECRRDRIKKNIFE